MAPIMKKKYIWIVLPPFYILLLVVLAVASTTPMPPQFIDEDEINLYCLKQAYPTVQTAEKDSAGRTWLFLDSGKKVLYEDPFQNYGNSLEVDIKTSMSQRYPLEPARPVPSPGFSPGRRRSYEFLKAVYGQDAQSIKRKLKNQRLLGKNISLAPVAAAALSKSLPELISIAENPHYRQLLKPDGGFYWRRIAGEPYLSAHSFGIAFDIGSNRAPYWRWSRQMPHPMQQSYPQEIVEELEKQGFIWGGKWHEYDLMHFEYRPEIICKSKFLDRIKE